MTKILIGEMYQEMIKKLFLLFFCSVIFACTRSSSLNTHPDYAHFIGKSYKTKQAFVVLKNDDDRRNYLIHFPGQEGVPKIKEMQSFPYEDKEYSRTIYGILPKGSILQIQNIYETNSIEWNMIDYYVTVQSPNIFQGKEILALLITNRKTKPVPQLDPKYVEEVIETE